jgi:hypothetical protein
MEIDELAVKITGDSTSLQSAMKAATDAVGKLGIGTAKLNGLLGAAGLAGAFKLAYNAANVMVQAYRDDEVALLKYNAALAASTVITAQGKRALDDYVPVFASIAGIAEADTQAIIAMLSATGRNDAEIKMMMETALGMSSVLGGDVNSALTQLTQTLTGLMPRTGALKLALDGLTTEQLKNGEGIRVLNQKYGDFSGTLKNSADVSIKNFQNAWSDLMSTMGQSVEGTIQPVRNAMTGLFREIIKQTQDSNSALEIFATGFNNFVNIFKQAALSVIGKGNIFAAIDEAINHTEQKTRQLMVLYAGLEDPLQKRIRLEKEAAEKARQEAAATASAAEAAAKAATKAQIEGRKEAQKAYEDSLAQIDTMVKLGVITEQEAADAKYLANRKLIDDLIALGYTGAKETKQIGDQALADAVARNNALYENTSEGHKSIFKSYEEYLKYAAEVERIANAQKLIEYQAYLKDREQAARYAEEVERIAQEQKLIDYQAYLKDMEARAAYQAEVERIANEQKGIEYNAYLAEMGKNAAYAEEVERIAQEQKLIEYQAYLDEMDAKAKLAEEIARIAREQALIEYQSYLNDMAEKAAYAAEVERIAQEQKLIDYQAYLDEMETKSKLAAETERIAREQQLVEYQQYLKDMASLAAYNDEKARIEQEQKLVEYQAYLKDMEAAAKYAAEVDRIANEQKLIEYHAYLDEMGEKEKLAQETARIAQEQKLIEYIAYLGDMEAAAKYVEEKDRIANEQKLIEYGQYLKDMEQLAAYQAAKEQAEYGQRTIEYEQYLSDMADAAAYAAEKERIEAEQRGIDYAASYEEYLAAMEEKAAKARIEQAEYARAVEAADVEAKKSSIQKKIEAIQAQLEKELLLVGDNENAKKILIETANQEIIRLQSITFAQYGSIAARMLSQLFLGIGALVSAQATAAIDAIEKRLENLKKSYGDTASELQTMYDALERMGAREKAATIKAQLDKEKAIEDYTSLSMEQLASLYATAIELGDDQAAAEITTAMARVKAEKDAAEEIKQIKYDAAVAEWNMKLMSTTASAAQAVMDSYKSMIGFGPVVAALAAAASTAFGITQIAAVAEAKPKLDTGGVIRAREETPFAVGKGTGEIMFGTSSLGDPLMQGFADLVASRVSGSPGMKTLLPVQIVLDGRVLAESTVQLIDDGKVRFRKPLKVAQR